MFVKMWRGLLIFLAVCTFTAAMVPRNRRAINSEDVMETTTKETKKICADTTPCAWSIYKPITKIIEYNLENTYCECSSNTVCTIHEDDSSANALVHKCRPPNESEVTESYRANHSPYRAQS